MNIKNKIKEIIMLPFKVIDGHRVEFIIWFIFTIIVGQLGIIINIIIRCYSSSLSPLKSLLIDSNNGVFYTVSIALVASFLGPLFINVINKEGLNFTILKIFTIISSVFFLFFSGIIYAVIQSNRTCILSPKMQDIDWSQLVVYIIAMGIVLYGYCILRLDKDPQKFEEYDDSNYADRDNKEVDNALTKSKNLTKTKEGIKL